MWWWRYFDLVCLIVFVYFVFGFFCQDFPFSYRVGARQMHGAEVDAAAHASGSVGSPGGPPGSPGGGVSPEQVRAPGMHLANSCRAVPREMAAGTLPACLGSRPALKNSVCIDASEFWRPGLWPSWVTVCPSLVSPAQRPAPRGARLPLSGEEPLAMAAFPLS